MATKKAAPDKEADTNDLTGGSGESSPGSDLRGGGGSEGGGSSTGGGNDKKKTTKKK